MVADAFGSENPHPLFPFWNCAASALQTPTPEALAQQAELQSALETQPPVMNWEPLPDPTFLAPALLGVMAWERLATWFVSEKKGERISKATY